MCDERSSIMFFNEINSLRLINRSSFNAMTASPNARPISMSFLISSSQSASIFNFSLSSLDEQPVSTAIETRARSIVGKSFVILFPRQHDRFTWHGFVLLPDRILFEPFIDRRFDPVFVCVNGFGSHLVVFITWSVSIPEVAF